MKGKSMNKKIINNNKGFGLLEVLISISVVIIGILPLINLFNSVLESASAS